MTFVAFMLQKILGNICFSKQLGVPVPSPPAPPPTPHPKTVTLGCVERWNKWMYLLPWGNKSAPCGVVAIGKGSVLGLLEAVSLDLQFGYPLTCFFFYWAIPKNIRTMPRMAFQNSEGKVGVLWTRPLCFLLREKLFHGVCSFLLLHLFQYTKKMPQIGHICEPCWGFWRVWRKRKSKREGG